MNSLENAAPATVTAPKIELRKLKICGFMSEETLCYTAEVWVNGKPGFETKNDGHGGCDFYTAIYDRVKSTFLHNEFDAAMATLKDYAASLPLKLWPKDFGKAAGEGHPQDVESIIADLITEHQKANDVEKMVKKCAKAVVMIDGGKVFTVKAAAPGMLEQQIASVAKRYPKATIVNRLSPDDARKILAAHLFA